jgi:hypothetical protein
VRGTILHEPALFALLDDVEAVRAPLLARVRPAMQTGGPRAAVEPWWRYVAGDDGWNKLAPGLRERMRASSRTLFDIELGTYERYLPDDETLASIAPRVRLLISSDGLPACAEVARRLGERLGVELECTPGTHAAYHDRPRELAETIRPPLRQLSAVEP